LKFQVLSTTGQWITFHIIQLPNTINTPSFTNPMLPMQMAATNTGNTTDLRIASGSWNAGTEGDPRNRAGFRTFIISNSGTTLPSAGTEINLITIHNKPTFNGVANKIELRFVGLGGGALESSDIQLLRFRKNATVTGTVFSDVNTSASVVEFSTAGTYTAGTGTIVFIRPSNSEGNGSQMQLLSQSDAEIILLPGETLTVTGTSFTGTQHNVIGILMWEERF
ncbi:MAG TPA: hypothetical protein VGW78_03310, partial [Candidatus Babeliales bacterium]|nr:hypothetical protein [Candidatus Babeliales bacterium]